MLKKEIITVWLAMEQQLFQFIDQKVRDKEVSRDILQDVFLKMHNGIGSLRDESRLTPWIFQIARNAVMDYFRMIGKQKMPDDTVILSPKESENEGFDEALEDMIRMMDKLPEEYCEALCDTELKGMSQKAYAQKTGISYSGAKSRIQRARKMLKDLLLECCHFEFDKYGTVISVEPHCCCCCPEG
jgi:RNA polymerase sigma-70 factor (ECF subfamily)